MVSRPTVVGYLCAVQWGPSASLITAVVVASITGLCIFWDSAKERVFYTGWVRGRVRLLRLVGVVGHGCLGAVGAIGAAQLKWLPFGNPVLNGVVYAAAVEATVRANVAGLQVVSPGRVWSLVDLLARQVGGKLDEHVEVAIDAALDGLSSTVLAAKATELQQASLFVDYGKAKTIDLDFTTACAGAAPTKELLVRMATSHALVCRWKKPAS